MTDRTVVLAVGTYWLQTAAEQDFQAARSMTLEGALDRVAIGLTRVADGTITIDGDEGRPGHLPGMGALLAGALTVVAPPLGLGLLAPVIAGGVRWAAVSAIVDHFWHSISKNDRRHMTELIDRGEGGLVVVGVDHTADEIESLLSGASERVVTTTGCAHCEQAFTDTPERRQFET